MGSQIVCADCGTVTEKSNSDRGRLRWCTSCEEFRSVGDLYYLYPSCYCCGEEFEYWAENSHCDPCQEYGCEEIGYLMGCPRKKNN